MKSPRLTAARVLKKVLAGESLSRALPVVSQELTEKQRPVAQALVYGVLRHFELLEALAAQLLKKPFKSKDEEVYLLLLTGLFELRDERTASHAVVNETIKLVKSRRQWAAGLVNACLRRYQREREELEASLQDSESARFGLPEWWIVSLKAAWPEQWQSIAEQFSEAAPMTLRVNLSKVDRETYQKQLQELDQQSTVNPFVLSALTLENPVDVSVLKGFAEGLVSVQDAAAQLSAYVVAPAKGERLLDACAAPGGKMAHLLEAVNGECEVTAVELDPRRIEKVESTLARLGFQAEVKVADAADLDSWWDGRAFDRVLLDAPCSATGTVRRNPDVKRHRKPTDIPALVEQQRRLLDRLWETLRPGGMLVYATCSIFPEENEQQMASFLARHDDAEVSDIKEEWGHATGVGRQILPGESGMDGFFYARMKKR